MINNFCIIIGILIAILYSHVNAKCIQYNLKNQQIYQYIPDKVDWQQGCTRLVHQQLKLLKINRSHTIGKDIASGIQIISTIKLNLTPKQKFEVCKWAIATAQQESSFRFVIGGAGEIGMYQFKLDTIRMVGNWYKLKNLAKGTDHQLVKWLLNPIYATSIFVLYYYRLQKYYDGDLTLAWKRYNSGKKATAYSLQVFNKYEKIKQIKPVWCQDENQTIQ